MGKKTSSSTRLLCGILGSYPGAAALQKEGNAYFRKANIDAFLARYPATTETLPERLSEMFHFDRRFYICAEALSSAILPLVDVVDVSADTAKKVTVIVNRNGVLTGYFFSPPSVSLLCQLFCLDGEGISA